MTGCMHYRIEDRAARTPGATAAVHGEDVLTYRELDFRANQLAHLLRRYGADRGQFVAVRCDFGFALLVAMLGILKTGAAYVPIAPDTPLRRLQTILAQTDCTVLVTQDHLAHHGVMAHHVVALDDDWRPIADLDRSAGDRVSEPDDVAYCIFTSGSTGTPKGALNTHQGLANLCAWYAQEDAGGGPTARTMVVSSIAFDLTQKNLLEPLASGGLLIFGGDTVGDAAGMAAAIGRHRPTRVNCAPSAFELFEDILLAGPLRMVVLGGEPIPPRLAEAITGRRIALMNSYGPTECSDVATYHVARTPVASALPLGKPIPNVAIHLLDDASRPIAGAGTGELCIAGVGVGRGYLGQPELTAAHFVRLPVGGRDVRLYRTGDIVRRSAGGDIHYVERRDRQLKIRGNRVELGEIEACLASHPAVRTCAITDFIDDGGDTRIAALVVARELANPTSLAGHLRERLPGYMLPALWRIVDTLPLTGSGKIDRIAIRELAARAFRSGDRDAPQVASPTERHLMRMWSEALGRGSVNPEDDFFALGGDSLAALHISMAVHDQWRRRLTVDQIYTFRTIRALGHFLDATETPDDMPIQRLEDRTDGDVFIPSVDQLSDLRETTDTTASLQHISFGLELRGRFDLDRFTRAMDEVIERQEALRTAFEYDQTGTLVARILQRPAWKPECLDPPARPSKTGRQRLVDAMRAGRIDPFRAPAMRCILVRDSPLLTYCGFVLHHAVADAWSMSALTRDIAAAYERLAGYAIVPLRRYTRELNGDASADGFEPQMRYWRAQLGDLPPQRMPFGVTARPSATDAGQVVLDIDPEQVEAIHLCGAAQGTTPYAVILTALFLALHRAGCGEDLHVRSPSSNRAGRSLESVVGPFASRLVIRASITASSHPAGLLADVAERIREAHRHAGLSAALFDRCMPPRPPGAIGPRFQIAYNHHSYPPHPRRWGDIDVSRLEDDFARIRGSLALHSWPAERSMRCVLAYNLSVFDHRHAEALARLLRTAISEISAAAPQETSDTPNGSPP